MKSYVFYDDTADYEAYDEIRSYLFDLHGEDNGWETADDVPDNWVYDEISEQNNADWRELLHDLGRVFKEDCYLLTGTCGRWCGPAQGGKFINSTDDLLTCIRHLDKVKLYEENGHFYIDGYHHDGSDHYELKRLTKKAMSSRIVTTSPTIGNCIPPSCRTTFTRRCLGWRAVYTGCDMKTEMNNPYGYKVCYKEAGSTNYIRHFKTYTYRQAVKAKAGYIRFPPRAREDGHILNKESTK